MAGMRRTNLMQRPSHPGDLIREDILPALKMSVTDLAAHLGVSRVSLSELIHTKRSVSIDMARRLGQAFGNGASFWLSLQLQYDLRAAERRTRISVTPLRWKAQRP